MVACSLRVRSASCFCESSPALSSWLMRFHWPRRDLVGLERGFQRLGDGALRVVHEESDEAVMLVDHA